MCVVVKSSVIVAQVAIGWKLSDCWSSPQWQVGIFRST